MSCSEREMNLTEAEKQKIVDSVRLTLNNYFSDVEKAGLIAEFRYLDTSSDFYWVPPGYSSPISYDSVAAILKKYQPVYTFVKNSWESLLVHPLKIDLASYSGRIRSEMTDSSGKQTSFSLVETGLAIKRKSGWKLLSGQTSVIEH